MKIKSRTQLRKINPKHYYELEKEGLLDKLYPGRKLIKWTDNSAIQNAKKYKTKVAWIRSKNTSYQYACKYKNLFTKCTKHMVNLWNKYDLNTCKNLALKYEDRSSFSKKHRGAYKTILRNNWQDKCFFHMNYIQKPWTNNEIIKDAKKYKTRQEWDKNSSAAQLARKRKIIELCCNHMKPSVTGKKNVINLDTKKKFKSMTLAAKYYKIMDSWTIGQAIKKSGTGGGYRWAYCDTKGKVIK